MIAFDSRKRHHGGIGNLMFQYAPTRMTARPGYAEHRNLTCDEWIEIRTVNPILEHYRLVYPFARMYRALGLLRQRTGNLLSGGSADPHHEAQEDA